MKNWRLFNISLYFDSKLRQQSFLSRPRDVSCLFVVSFSSTCTIPWASSFITVISVFDLQFTNAYNYIMFCSLRPNRRVLKTSSNLAVINKVH